MRKLYALTFFTIYIFSLTPQLSQAQADAIVPDRPGFSTGTFTVPVGQFYVEAGYQFSFRSSYDLRASNIPALNIRTGLSENSELFIGWDGVELIHSESESESEFPVVGSKYRLKQSDLFELTLISTITGSKSNDTFYVDPLVGLMWETELANRIGHFGGIQIESETNAAKREWLPALASGLEFELSDRVSTFVEYYTIYSGSEKEFYHATEIGLLYYPVPTFQIDLFGGIGYNEEIPNYVGAGISFLF